MLSSPVVFIERDNSVVLNNWMNSQQNMYYLLDDQNYSLKNIGFFFITDSKQVVQWLLSKSVSSLIENCD